MGKASRLVLVLLIVGAMPLGLVLAQDAEGAAAEKGEKELVKGKGDSEKNEAVTITPGAGLAVAGAAIGAGLAAIGGGYAIARVGSHCIESMARQPEAAGSMFAPMIVTAAMIEGAMLFAIAVCLMIVLSAI